MRWLLVASLLVGPAMAQEGMTQEAGNPSFYLVNRSASAISRVFASPAGMPNWGSNRVGAVVGPGENVAVRLPADGQCVYDLRVVYANGRGEERRGVNVCEIDNISFPQGRTVLSGRGAADPSFVLVNRGRAALTELYLSPSGDDSWGEDRMGDATLAGGSSKTVRLPRGECVYDLRVVFANGEANEKRRLNLCQITDLRVP